MGLVRAWVDLWESSVRSNPLLLCLVAILHSLVVVLGSGLIICALAMVFKGVCKVTKRTEEEVAGCVACTFVFIVMAVLLGAVLMAMLRDLVRR